MFKCVKGKAKSNENKMGRINCGNDKMKKIFVRKFFYCLVVYSVIIASASVSVSATKTSTPTTTKSTIDSAEVVDDDVAAAAAGGEVINTVKVCFAFNYHTRRKGKRKPNIPILISNLNYFSL